MANPATRTISPKTPKYFVHEEVLIQLRINTFVLQVYKPRIGLSLSNYNISNMKIVQFTPFMYYKFTILKNYKALLLAMVLTSTFWTKDCPELFDHLTSYPFTL